MDNRSSALYNLLRTDINMYRARKGMDLFGDHVPIIAQWNNLDDAVTGSIMRSITKKYIPRKADPLLAAKAISLFQQCNEECRGHDWDNTALLLQMQAIADRELLDLDWQTALMDLSIGAGASVASRGRNTFFEKLFVNSLTTTESALYSEYRKFMLVSNSWTAAEIKRFSLLDGERYSVVKGSKLSTVRKSSSIDRTICTEPSLNMLFQLSLGAQFERVLKDRYGYDKALQPDRNRFMACQGSLDGRACTIDLSSASDTIALSLCRKVLPGNWYAAILDCRSPVAEINGEYYHLRMVSSMGNGFTFPLQTYLFSLLVKSICTLKGVPFERYERVKSFGVFGDDIVVPVELYDDVIEGLISLGFKPNPDKSFKDGLFRESCGTDWWQGVNVRGVYCKSLSRPQDIYSLLNRLNRWSGRHRIPLPSTCAFLLSLVKAPMFVPLDESDIAGLKVPSSCLPRRLTTYSSFVPKRKLFRIIQRNGHLRLSHNNPLGLMITAAMGACSSSGLDRRQDPVRYAKVFKHTPNWDRLDVQGPDGASLEAYTYAFWTNMSETLKLY